MKPFENFYSGLYRILMSSGKYLYGIFMYSDLSIMVHKKKHFRSQLMNWAPYFACDITLLTKSLVYNMEAEGEPFSMESTVTR